MTMRLASLRCACGSPDLIAVRPGAVALFAPLRKPRCRRGVVVGTIIQQPRDDDAWCPRCWPSALERAT